MNYKTLENNIHEFKRQNRMVKHILIKSDFLRKIKIELNDLSGVVINKDTKIDLFCGYRLIENNYIKNDFEVIYES